LKYKINDCYTNYNHSIGYDVSSGNNDTTTKHGYYDYYIAIFSKIFILLYLFGGIVKNSLCGSVVVEEARKIIF